MKKFITTVLVICSLFIPANQLMAQPQTEQEILDGQGDLESDLGQQIIVGNNAFSIILTREVQNPDNYEITYKLTVSPNITTDRVEIEWFVQGMSEALTEKKKQMSVTKGNIFTETFVIYPRNTSTYGKTEVRVEIRSFGADGNNIAAARDQFLTNQDKEIFPLSEDYQRAKTLATIRNVAITVGIIIALVLGSMYGYKRFKQWLADENPSIRDSYKS